MRSRCYRRASTLHRYRLEIATGEVGQGLRARGKYSEAESFYKQAIAIYKKASDEERPEFAACLNNLAELYRVQGEYAKAEPLLRRSLFLWMLAQTGLGAGR